MTKFLRPQELCFICGYDNLLLETQPPRLRSDNMLLILLMLKQPMSPSTQN